MSSERDIWMRVIKAHLDDREGNWVEIGDSEVRIATKSAENACDEIAAYSDFASVTLWIDTRDILDGEEMPPEGINREQCMGWFSVIHDTNPGESISDHLDNQYMHDLLTKGKVAR